MNVLMNAASANMGGALTYVTNILREIPSLTDTDKFIVVLPAEVAESLNGSMDKSMIELISYPSYAQGGIFRPLTDNWILPRLCRRYNADILFSTTGFGSLRSPCPEIVLVRNAAYFCPIFEMKCRQAGKPVWPLLTRRWMSVMTIRKADRTVFPSYAMRCLVEKHVRLDEKKTSVLPYGFAEKEFFQNSAKVPEIVPDILTWKKQGFRIILNVSPCAIQKNLETVLNAFPGLVAAGMKVKFVTTISRGFYGDPLVYDRLMRQVRELGLEDVFVSAGHLKYDQLQYLYKNADIFVFPSFTESFGHPLVEAMACGLPVIASDTPVNRELCGSAAVYFETFNPDECFKTIKKILQNDHEKTLMAQRSLERAKAFSWKDHCLSLLDMMRQTIRTVHE